MNPFILIGIINALFGILLVLFHRPVGKALSGFGAGFLFPFIKLFYGSAAEKVNSAKSMSVFVLIIGCWLVVVGDTICVSAAKVTGKISITRP